MTKEQRQGWLTLPLSGESLEKFDKLAEENHRSRRQQAQWLIDQYITGNLKEKGQTNETKET